MSKSKKKSPSKEPVQQVKIKSNIGETLSIVIPLALVFIFLVGGVFLFIYMEESRRLPDEEYLRAEQIVNSGVLIGKTLEECVEEVGFIAMIDPAENWFFPMGTKMFKSGEGLRIFEIYVEQEDGVAVSAVLREQG